MAELEIVSKYRDVLSTKQVADEYRIPEATLRYWRHRNEGPASFSRGRRVFYRRAAIEEWFAAQEAASLRGGAA